MATKIQIGVLILAVLASSIYIMLPSEVKIQVDIAKTTFYVWNDSWIVSGVEYSKLFNGSKSVYKSASLINSSVDGSAVKIVRDSPFSGNIRVVDTYLFDGNVSDKTLVPIAETHNVLNAKGLIYQYEVQKLPYSGVTMDLSGNEFQVGQMMVRWDGTPYLAKIYSNGKILLKYRVASDDETYNVRLFDPLITSYSKQDFFPKLLSNTADITSGEASFQFCNPTTVNLPFDKDKLTTILTGKCGGIRSLDMFYLKQWNATVSERVWIPNISFAEKSRIVIDNITGLNSTILYNESVDNGWFKTMNKTILQSEYFPIPTVASIKAKSCYDIRLHADWNPAYRENGIECDWIPRASISGTNFTQDSWAWWNQSWTSRKPIIINGSTSALTNYQVMINLNWTSGMNSTFTDLRFTDNSTNGIPLPYWIENYTAGVNATVWVKTNLSIGNNTLYLYYGNPSALSVSNPNTTFIAYQDGTDTSKWAITNDATTFASETVNGRVALRLNDTGTQVNKGMARLEINQTVPIIVTFYVLAHSGLAGSYAHFSFINETGITSCTGEADAQIAEVTLLNDGARLFRYWNYTTANTGSAWSEDTWYALNITLNYTNQNNIWFNGVQQGSNNMLPHVGATKIRWIEISAGCGGANQYWGAWNNIIVRQYASPNPVVLSVGAEETSADTIPPSIQIQSPANTTYASSSVDLNYTVGDNIGVSQCKYELDGANTTLATCANTTLSGLSWGQHNVKIWVNDTSNNWNNSATISFVTKGCGNLGTANTVYTLIGNVSNSGTCFTIGANNITINGSGYKITSGTSGSNNYGIYSNINYNKVIINNLLMHVGNPSGASNFAIYAKLSNSTIRSNEIISYDNAQGIGIYLLNSFSNLIDNNTFIEVHQGYAYGIVLQDNSDYNIVSNNTIGDSGWYYSVGIGIYINCDYNQLLDNQISMTGSGSFGVDIENTSYSNNISGGSISSLNPTVPSYSQGYDYYLLDTGYSTYFKNVNFTKNKTIGFGDTTSWFNYNNQTEGNIWLKTSVSGASYMVRVLLNWSNTSMIWNDTASAALTATYNLSGLIANQPYTVMNGSTSQTIYADSSGNLNASLGLSSGVSTAIQVILAPSPPFISIQSPTNSTYSSSNVDLNYTTYDTDGISSCKYELNGATNVTLPNCGNTSFTAVERNNLIRVYANDTINNWNSSDVSFTVDTIPPNVNVQLPVNGVWYTSLSRTLNYTTYDVGGISQCKQELNGVNTTLATCQNNSFTAIEGTNNIAVWANDTINNWNRSIMITFYTDTTLPFINIQEPTQSTWYTTTNISLNYTVWDLNGLSSCKYELNGANTTIGICVNTSFIAIQGSNTVKIWANDSNNNWNSSTAITFNVDSIPPIISIQVPSNTTYNKQNTSLNYTVWDLNGLSQCKYELNKVNTTIGLCVNTSFIAVERNNTVKVWANDSKGNWNSSSLVSFTVDTFPPLISVQTPTNTTYGLSLNRTLNYTVFDVGGVSQCKYELNNVNTTIGLCVNTTFIGIEGGNKIKVWANDTINNWNSSQLISFTLDTIPPTITIQVPLAGYNYTSTTVNLNYTVWDASGISSCKRELDGSNTTIANCANTTMSSLGQGTHRVKVWANDTLNNWNVSSTINFTVDTVAPTTTLTTEPASPNGANGWFILNTNFTLSCSDATSGCSITRYNLNAGGWTAYSSKVVVSTEQNNTVMYYSNDTAGNNETIKTGYIPIDKTRPSLTSILFNDTTPKQWIAGGWNIRANSTITDSNSRVSAVRIEIDGVNYTVTTNVSNTYYYNFTLSDVGVHNITFYANDTAGWSNNSGLSIFTINKATSLITLLIDGLEQNKSVINGSTVNFTISSLPTGVNISLYDSGSLLNNSISPYTRLKTYEIYGAFPIVANWSGNANWTSASVDLKVTVIGTQTLYLNKTFINKVYEQYNLVGMVGNSTSLSDDLCLSSSHPRKGNLYVCNNINITKRANSSYSTLAISPENVDDGDWSTSANTGVGGSGDVYLNFTGISYDNVYITFKFGGSSTGNISGYYKQGGNWVLFYYDVSGGDTIVTNATSNAAVSNNKIEYWFLLNGVGSGVRAFYEANITLIPRNVVDTWIANNTQNLWNDGLVLKTIEDRNLDGNIQTNFIFDKYASAFGLYLNVSGDIGRKDWDYHFTNVSLCSGDWCCLLNGEYCITNAVLCGITQETSTITKFTAYPGYIEPNDCRISFNRTNVNGAGIMNFTAKINPSATDREQYGFRTHANPSTDVILVSGNGTHYRFVVGVNGIITYEFNTSILLDGIVYHNWSIQFNSTQIDWYRNGALIHTYLNVTGGIPTATMVPSLRVTTTQAGSNEYTYIDYAYSSAITSSTNWSRTNPKNVSIDFLNDGSIDKQTIGDYINNTIRLSWFNDSQTSKSIQFNTTDQYQIYYLRMPKTGINITSASILVNTTLQNRVNFTMKCTDSGVSCSASASGGCTVGSTSNMIDGDSATGCRMDTGSTSCPSGSVDVTFNFSQKASTYSFGTVYGLYYNSSFGVPAPSAGTYRHLVLNQTKGDYSDFLTSGGDSTVRTYATSTATTNDLINNSVDVIRWRFNITGGGYQYPPPSTCYQLNELNFILETAQSANYTLDIGFDGAIEDIYIFTSSELRQANFSQGLTNYLANCTADSFGVCTVPVYLSSKVPTSFVLQNLEINYTINPLSLSASSLNSYLSANCSGTAANTTCNIPIKISSSAAGNITASYMLDYEGFGSYQWNLTNLDGSTVYDTRIVNVSYSGGIVKYPNQINAPLFYFRVRNDSNVSLYGQINNSGVNLTAWNYKNPMNISIKLNTTIDCINVSYSNLYPAQSLTYITSDGFVQLVGGLSFNQSSNIYLYATSNNCNKSTYITQFNWKGRCLACW